MDCPSLYPTICMPEHAKKVDYIIYYLNKGMSLSALINSRVLNKYNKLIGTIIDIRFEYPIDKLYPAIYVTVILEAEFWKEMGACKKIEVSIDDIVALYLKDETKVGGKTMTDKEKFTPKRINFRSKKDEYYTDVLWADGTVTVVKLKENEDFDEHAAFCAALAKKIFGSSNAVNTIVKKTACYPLTKAQKKSIGRMKKAIEKEK